MGEATAIGLPEPGHGRRLLQTLLGLAWIVEARDPYTGGHLWRVSRFSMLLARRIGCSEAEVARIGIGGFLHDLGKVAIPDAVLNKPGKLTDEEYAIIKTHPLVGADLLSAHPLRHLAHEAAFLHHETPDGRGYPMGLTGSAIPLAARIIGLTDAFDAMTSTRPYRRGMPSEKAEEIVLANLGTQFDRSLGEAFLGLASEGALTHVIGHSEPNIPLQPCVECGPTILVTRAHRDGETLFCRSCGGGVILHREGGAVRVTDSDRHGTPEELRAVIDDGLIEELLETSYREILPPL